MGSVGKPRIGEVWPVRPWFCPTDDELINNHLKRKFHTLQEACRVIPELNIYRWDPQVLFEKYDEMSDLPSDGRECFFYRIQRGKNRETSTGFWKGTGKEHTIWGHDGEEIGFKKIFVYHEGRQPYCRKSLFSMQEYHLNRRAEDTIGADRGLTEIVLCRIVNRVFKKTNADSPSSKCIDPDPGTPGAGAITSQRDDQASPQVWSQLNLTEAEIGVPSNEHDGEEKDQLLQSYESSCDDEQHLFTYNGQFRVVGGSSSSVSSSDYGLDDDGLFLSELWD